MYKYLFMFLLIAPAIKSGDLRAISALSKIAAEAEALSRDRSGSVGDDELTEIAARAASLRLDLNKVTRGLVSPEAAAQKDLPGELVHFSEAVDAEWAARRARSQ